MSVELGLKEDKHLWHGSIRSYAIGFTASIILTSISFLLVAFEIFSPQVLLHTISVLALVQAAFQLRYFLHLGEEGSPYWETFIFLFMFFILVIIVGGTLWIMHDLNVRTMHMGDM